MLTADGTRPSERAADENEPCCYTFVFNWAFDAIFGLPASATGAAQPA